MSLATSALSLRLGRSLPVERPPVDGDPDRESDGTGFGRRRASAPLAIALLAVLMVVIPALFYALTPHRQPAGTELLLIYLTIALSGARLSVLVAGRRIRIFESVLWSFYYAFLGIAPLVQEVSQSWPGTTPDLPAGSVLGAGLITLVSAVALLSGAFVLPGRPGHELFKRVARPFRPASIARISLSRPEPAGPAQEAGGTVRRWRLWALFAIFLIAGSIYYSRIGLSNIFESREVTNGLKGEAYADPVQRVVDWALTSIPLLCLAIAMILNWRRVRPTLAVRVATVLVGLLAVLVFNPLSNPRFVFGAGVLGLLGALGVYATLARYRIFVTGLLASIVLIFPYLDFARYAREDLAPTKGGPLQALTTGDFDAFAQIANTWAYLHEFGPTGGRQALGVVLFWIPRSMWVNKPEDTGILLAHFRQYTFTNLSAPLPAEIMINFSWIGLVLICFLIGRGLLHLDLLVDRRLRTGSTGPTVSYVLPFYMLILLRGSLLQAMAYLFTILASSWLLRFSGNSTKPTGPGRPQSSTSLRRR